MPTAGGGLAMHYGQRAADVHIVDEKPPTTVSQRRRGGEIGVLRLVPR
jgi:hypothetical protein